MTHIHLSGLLNPNAAHNHLYNIDANHNITGCNDSQANTLGLSSSSEVIGRHLTDILSSIDSSALINNNERVLKADSSQLIEESLLLSNGCKVIYSSYKYPLKSERNRFIGLAGMSIPIEVIFSNKLPGNHDLPSELKVLTPIQLKCLYFILKGWSSIKIVKKMNLSHSLIEVHFRHILLKLNYRNLKDLATHLRFSVDEIARSVQSNEVIGKLDDHFLIPHALDNQSIRLTKQHSRCFRLLLQGYTAKEIADRMNLSYRTIQHYSLSICQQLGLSTSREFIYHYASFLCDNI